jgi:hypothetical protein
VGQASPELPIYNNIREEDLKTLLAWKLYTNANLLRIYWAGTDGGEW